ncbi:MAG: hypothetical protein IPG83_17820 [Novosphingobium sp.]|nr:hypothetical protein [Novosphingobium sp.]
MPEFAQESGEVRSTLPVRSLVDQRRCHGASEQLADSIVVQASPKPNSHSSRGGTKARHFGATLDHHRFRRAGCFKEDGETRLELADRVEGFAGRNSVTGATINQKVQLSRAALLDAKSVFHAGLDRR